jgi:hypothetical protein
MEVLYRAKALVARQSPSSRLATLVIIAAGVRLLWWLTIPGDRFATDEWSYYQVGTKLLGGERNTFWPPFTGWVVAAAEFFLQTTSPKIIRLLWIAIDLWCMFATRALALRVGEAVHLPESLRQPFGDVAAVAYGLYLPAVAFSQFMTSEVPALALILGALLLVTVRNAHWSSSLGAGFLLAGATLARPNLLPMLAALPVAGMGQGRTHLGRAVLSVAVGAVVIGGIMFWNWRSFGEFTIARNAAYNFYIGNRDFYAEDLNLFAPRATAAQILFRRQLFANQLVEETRSSRELRRDAANWIVAHPAQFARRALGRLARVFVPRTDVLDLIGGESRAGIFSPRSIAILGLANLEWGVVLIGGVAGLVAIGQHARELGVVLWTALASSLVLCLVAISKPRYSFAFDPILLIGAAYCAFERRAALAAAWSRHRLLLALIFAFLAWSWLAWLIFAFSSRLALAAG